MSIVDLETVKVCVLGHAVADALGVPVEFKSREWLDKKPVKTMLGYGTYGMPAGSWSDDTTMVLCALDALAKETFSWADVMENFVSWYYSGAFTPTGSLFDIGDACAKAIRNYAERGYGVARCGNTDPGSNGNGSLMRILPFALYAPGDTALAEKASSLTHAHRRSQMACGIFTLVMQALLETGEKDAYRLGLERAAALYGGEPEWAHYAPLLSIKERSRESIRSSGYVVDSLEAALWCFVTTDSYAECVLKAVNLGEDTDTVAAIAGDLAAAVYGLAGIPQEWLDTLLRRDYIEELCEKACRRWQNP